MANDEIKTSMDKNFESLATVNFGSYEDQWIIMIDGEIVNHGNNERLLIAQTKEQYPGRIPFIVKVPKKNEEFLL
jgi:hypothetical protein